MKLEHQIKEIGDYYYESFLKNEKNTPVETIDLLKIFSRVLQEGDCAIGKPPIKPKIIGKTNLAWLFKMHIDPLLDNTITRITTISSEIKNEIEHSPCNIGVKNANHSDFIHDPKYLKSLSNLLLLMERIIDTQYDYGPLFKEATIVYQCGYLCSTLHDVVVKLTPPYQICTFCFRVAHETSSYCVAHMSSNNADYKNGQQTAKLLHFHFAEFKSEFIFWKSFLGEQAVCSNLTHGVQVSDLTDKYIYGSAVVYDHYFGTINDAFTKRWQSLPEMIMRLSQNNNENLYNLISIAYSKADSWEKFCVNFHNALDNKKENTKNPVWIYHIFVLALNWFEAEQRRADGIKPRDLIILEKTMDKKSAKDIALDLGVTQQAVTSRLRMLKQKGYL